MSNNNMHKTVPLTIGFVLLVSGLMLVLLWWPHVVALFQGVVGITMALGGLMVLYTVKQ